MNDVDSRPGAIRFLLVDALNLIRRVYAAHPGDDGPERAEGARRSSVRSLQRALRECRPSHAVVVFEGREPSWRHLLYRDYKLGNKPMPEALRDALPTYRESFAEIGVRSFDMPKLEADDVIGTLAVKIAAADGAAVILSTDKIFLQLISDRIFVRDHFKQEDLGREYVVRRFGVEPEKLIDALALAGDSTNNIGGVPGVGPKMAARLLADFDTLEAVLAAALDGTRPFTPKLRERLVDHADAARLAQSLVRLQIELDLGLNLKSLRYVA